MPLPLTLQRAARSAALALVLLASATAHASGVLRDIYGRAGFAEELASTRKDFHQGGATSDTHIQQPPPIDGLKSWRFNFPAGVARNVAGGRFTNKQQTALEFVNLSARRTTAALEFWINPNTTNTHLYISLISETSTQRIESTLRLSDVLEPADFANKWTFVRIPLRRFPSQRAAVYNPATGQYTEAAFNWANVIGFHLRCDTTGRPATQVYLDEIRLHKVIDPLTINGRHYQTPEGNRHYLWGTNLVSFYPPKHQAPAIAANLASLGINVVRPHHNYRDATDTNGTGIDDVRALSKFDHSNPRLTSTTLNPDLEAWDRYHFLNAQLREEGIHLIPSLHASRRIKPEDWTIHPGDPTDRQRWKDAVRALNLLDDNRDLFVMLPMIDERSELIFRDFARKFLVSSAAPYKNPYTNYEYGFDPQVLYIELMNEQSSEYSVVNENKFTGDTSYFAEKLQSRWNTFSDANNLARSPVYSPGNAVERNRFLRELDRSFFERTKAFIRDELKVTKPIVVTNLWRGEAHHKMKESLSDLVEEHAYTATPYDVVSHAHDLFVDTTRGNPVHKPYVVAEINFKVGDTGATTEQRRHRPSFHLANAVYGSFHDWSGALWFSWAHGHRYVGNHGWHTSEARTHAGSQGDMFGDAIYLDHARTTSRIFTRRLVSPSGTVRSWWADEPLGVRHNYNALMASKHPFRPGWQNVYSLRRAFGPVPSSQATANWMSTDAPATLVSDTNQIRKDTVRQQLTVSSPRAEAFSGRLDANAPAGLPRLVLGSNSGHATVILVSEDNKPIAESAHLIISRTYRDASGNERATAATRVNGLAAPKPDQSWRVHFTRPRSLAGQSRSLSYTNGGLDLPDNVTWHEAELVLQ